MTTVVAKRLPNNKGVVFASDTQSTAGYEKSKAPSKVFENGAVVFGFTGAVRDMDVLKYSLTVPEFKRKHRKNPKAWVVNRLVPAIRKTLDDCGRLETIRGQEEMDSAVLFAVEGLCGVINTDFALSETDNKFWSIGSGSSYALGALAMGASAVEAVEVASEFDIYTGPVSNELYKVEWV